MDPEKQPVSLDAEDEFEEFCVEGMVVQESRAQLSYSAGACARVCACVCPQRLFVCITRQRGLSGVVPLQNGMPNMKTPRGRNFGSRCESLDAAISNS